MSKTTIESSIYQYHVPSLEDLGPIGAIKSNSPKAQPLIQCNNNSEETFNYNYIEEYDIQENEAESPSSKSLISMDYKSDYYTSDDNYTSDDGIGYDWNQWNNDESDSSDLLFGVYTLPKELEQILNDNNEEPIVDDFNIDTLIHQPIKRFKRVGFSWIRIIKENKNYK